MQRIGYILLGIATDLISLLSQAISAFLFGGSTAQTLSARSHLEAPASAVWTGGAGSSTRSSSGSRIISGGLGRRRSSARYVLQRLHEPPTGDLV